MSAVISAMSPSNPFSTGWSTALRYAAFTAHLAPQGNELPAYVKRENED
jgi:hypothetical protein